MQHLHYVIYLCHTAVSIVQQLDDNREVYLEAVPVCVRRLDCEKTEKLPRNLRKALTADWFTNRFTKWLSTKTFLVIVWTEKSWLHFKIRMHSSGMCTARLLDVSSMYFIMHVLCRGMSARGGGVFPGGVCLGGVCLWSGGRCIPACYGGRHPPCGQTDTYENITSANFVCGR